MPAGLFVAIALLAQIAGATPAGAAPVGAAPDPVPAASAPPAHGPAQPAPPKLPVKTPEAQVKAAGRCAPAPPSANANEIVICAQRPEGYRLDPDVLEANRAKRSGRPKRPERMRDTSCASVGPMGCVGAGAGVNLLGAALTAAEMAARLATGKEIGSMFVTTPEPTEYQLYVEAKRRREAREAEAAAVAKAKAVQSAGAVDKEADAAEADEQSPP